MDLAHGSAALPSASYTDLPPGKAYCDVRAPSRDQATA